MQQTTNYKLNKPGMDDTFAVAPLNENADKLDGALAALDGRVAAADAKHCLFKLAGPVHIEKTTPSADFDLPAGFHTGDYAALILVGRGSTGANGAISVSLNSVSTQAFFSVGDSMGFSLLGPFKNGMAALYSVYANIATTSQVQTMQKQFTVPWADIQMIRIQANSATINDADITLYGLKA